MAERWIRSRLAATIREAREALEGYRFNDYANAIYQFTWHEFCDWYIEMSKLALGRNGGADAAKQQQFLLAILDNVLLLLHPVMPFVTEEIWQVCGANRPTIMLQPFPRSDASWVDAKTESQVDYLRDVIRAIRNLRTEMNCPPGKEVKIVLDGAEDDLSFLRAQEAYLRLLARVGAAEYSTSGARPKGAATAVVREYQYLSAAGRSDQR